MIFSTIISLAVIMFLIVLHEMGHFLVAIYFSIPVEEFSVGYGPEIASYKGKWTKYCLRAIPLGGYVMIEGMEDEKSSGSSFDKRALYQKVVVIIAGIAVNFALSFTIFFFVSLFRGHISEEKKSFIAHKSGSFEEEDRIVMINGSSTKKWKDVISILEEDSSDFKITTSNRSRVKNTLLTKEESYILINGSPRHFSLSKSILFPFKATYKGIKDSALKLKNMVMGSEVSGNLSGPVGIVNKISASLSRSLWDFFLLVAMLSMSLGFLNLLPIPGLDGGHLLLITLKSLNIKMGEKIENGIMFSGLALLAILAIVVTKSDILKLLGW